MALIQFSQEVVLHNKPVVEMILHWFEREYGAKIYEFSRGLYDVWTFELTSAELGTRKLNVTCVEIVPGVISITHD